MLLNMIFSDDSQRSGSALDQPKPYKSPAVKWVRCLCLYCVAYGAFAFCNSARLFFENLTQVLNQPYGSIEANQIHLRHFTQEVVYDSVNVIFYVVLMISLGLLLSAVNHYRDLEDQKRFVLPLALFMVSQLKFLINMVVQQCFFPEPDSTALVSIGEFLLSFLMVFVFAVFFIFIAADCRKGCPKLKTSRGIVVVLSAFLIFLGLNLLILFIKTFLIRSYVGMEFELIISIVVSAVNNIGQFFFIVSYFVMLILIFFKMFQVKKQKNGRISAEQKERLF